MCAYFIDISQGSVEMHLQCGGICIYHGVANCLQSVTVENFENQSIIGEDMDKSKVPRFLAHPVHRPACYTYTQLVVSWV